MVCEDKTSWRITLIDVSRSKYDNHSVSIFSSYRYNIFAKRAYHFDGIKLNQAESDAEVLSLETLSTDDSTAHGSSRFGSPKSKGSAVPSSPSTSQSTAEVSQESTGPDGQRVKTSSNTESLSGLCEF